MTETELAKLATEPTSSEISEDQRAALYQVRFPYEETFGNQAKQWWQRKTAKCVRLLRCTFHAAVSATSIAQPCPVLISRALLSPAGRGGTMRHTGRWTGLRCSSLRSPGFAHMT